ncbi:hypothetical protein AB837_00546 [bacterium AB1]|nr:hypothetical protein AB837_00546 [bacterium AB1]
MKIEIIKSDYLLVDYDLKVAKEISKIKDFYISEKLYTEDLENNFQILNSQIATLKSLEEQALEINLSENNLLSLNNFTDKKKQLFKIIAQSHIKKYLSFLKDCQSILLKQLSNLIHRTQTIHKEASHFSIKDSFALCLNDIIISNVFNIQEINKQKEETNLKLNQKIISYKKRHNILSFLN